MPANNEAPMITIVLNLSALFFRDIHKGRICMSVFIEVIFLGARG